MYVQLRPLEVRGRGGNGRGALVFMSQETMQSWMMGVLTMPRVPTVNLTKSCEDRWLKHMAEGAEWCQASEFKCGLLILIIEWGVGFTKITNLYNWAPENGQWAAASGYLIRKAGLMLAGHLGALVLSKGPSSFPPASPEHSNTILPP